MQLEILQQLIDGGYADDAGIAADVVDTKSGEKFLLCVNGELITLVTLADGAPQKAFRDSIDKFDGVNVKSGLFKKTLSFTHNGTDYAFAVKNGKNLLEYFKQLAD